MKLKKLILEARRALNWTVKIERRDDLDSPYGISSDPVGRIHYFLFPEKHASGLPINRFSEVHEYTHAWLCENVHHCFSCLRLHPNTDPRLYATCIRWVYNQTTDWFVNGRLFNVCLHEYLDNLKGHINRYTPASIDRMLNFDPFASPVTLASAMAEGLRHHVGRIEFPAYIDPSIRDHITGMANAFLSVDPDYPSVENVERLANAVFAVIYPCRIHRVRFQDVDCWEVIDWGAAIRREHEAAAL